MYVIFLLCTNHEEKIHEKTLPKLEHTTHSETQHKIVFKIS